VYAPSFARKMFIPHKAPELLRGLNAGPERESTGIPQTAQDLT
jgi:hypothetical protein